MTSTKRASYAAWLLLVVTLGAATGYVVGHRTGNPLFGLAAMIGSVALTVGLFAVSRGGPSAPTTGPE